MANFAFMGINMRYQGPVLALCKILNKEQINFIQPETGRPELSREGASVSNLKKNDTVVFDFFFFLYKVLLYGEVLF